MKLIKPTWPAPAQIKAFTTTRHIWGNAEPTLASTRLQLKELLDLPNDPIWIQQVHGTRVVTATAENKDQPADASYTTKPNQVCVILTADCLPILICDKKASVVAAVHAGWRGLAGGIIEQTLDQLPATPADQLLVWLGPGISSSKFEVGEDVFNAFTSAHSDHAKAFQPQPQAGKWLADLYLLAKLRLQRRGISHIFGGEFCTHSQNDLFFSYRRDKDTGPKGRMATTIWIDPSTR